METIADSKRIQFQFAWAAFAFTVALVGYLVGWGSPTNSLHESALSWGFFVLIGVLASTGLATVRDVILAWKGIKP
jgi:hypothetical protein